MFLGKAIDEETGNQLVATMLYLDSENKKDLNLYINCSGGDVSNNAYSLHQMHACLRWLLQLHSQKGAIKQAQLQQAQLQCFPRTAVD